METSECAKEDGVEGAEGVACMGDGIDATGLSTAAVLFGSGFNKTNSNPCGYFGGPRALGGASLDPTLFLRNGFLKKPPPLPSFPFPPGKGLNSVSYGHARFQAGCIGGKKHTATTTSFRFGTSMRYSRSVSSTPPSVYSLISAPSLGG